MCISRHVASSNAIGSQLQLQIASVYVHLQMRSATAASLYAHIYITTSPVLRALLRKFPSSSWNVFSMPRAIVVCMSCLLANMFATATF